MSKNTGDFAGNGRDLIFELRTYRFDTMAAATYLDLFQSEGLEHITKTLRMAGYWQTESGELNVLHHLWVYKDFADRAALRIALARNVPWTKSFAPKGFPMIRHQKSRFLALEEGSPTLSSVLHGLGEPHSPVPSGAPLYAEAWHGLSTSSEPPAALSGEIIARWRVLSGEEPGTYLTLIRFASAAAIVLPDVPAIRHEVLRPCCFSPLA